MAVNLDDRLLSAGLLSREQLDRALAISRANHRPLAAVLTAEGMISERALLPVLAEHHGMECVELADEPTDESAAKSVSAKLASHYGIVPLRLASGVLTIAVSDPLEMAGAEDIETNLGFHVERVLASREDIREALRRLYGVGAETVERILAGGSRPDDAVTTVESHDLEKMAEDASVVKLVNQLFHDAISDRATDIHFEVYRDGVVVRRRIDGVLYRTNVASDLRLLYPAIVSRVKLMSGLNIVERRLPQDGRARVKIGPRDYDLRISIVPAMHGEDIVIRILPAAMLFDLSQLGFSDAQLAALETYVSQPHGIIFVTGPTGSGKSTTLYACLSRLNTPERKIITIEDPVEYELRGITQTQVNPKIGLTFAKSLSSMLRHDPDVMMIGEVRDRDTAEIAIQTSMTGHLVLSTLHTNDAAGGAVRLIDMGIDPYLVTSTVLMFLAQRLVRVICPDCRQPVEVDGKRCYRGGGCRACHNSGFRGRSAISEVIPLAPEIQELILRKASAREIRAKADAMDMQRLVADGWQKVSAGVTTAEEVLRVTSM